jgi:hypothetical protein
MSSSKSWNRGIEMKKDENELIELNIPEKFPKCGRGAFYRMSPDEEEWRCHFCDPPPIVKQMREQNRN